MMLQALIGYADRNALGSTDDAFFQPVDVRWEVPVDRHGKLAGGPIPLLADSNSEKPRPKRFPRPFTSVNELGQGDKSHFLCDSLERAVLFLDAKAPEKAEARRIQHGYFKKLLGEAGERCPHEAAGLATLLQFLNDETELHALHGQLTAAKAKPTDNALFTVDGINFLYSDEVKEFWRARRRKMVKPPAEGAEPGRVCIATGQLAATLHTTEKIKGVPGGLAVGTNLISFDKDAFCSYGLEKAQNAALSAPAELQIRSALDQLIGRSREQKLVFNDTAHLHWTREPVVDDPLDLLAGADEKAVMALLHAVREGNEPDDIDATAYYATSLSGNGARIVVRDWLESTVATVKQHVAQWFEDLAIVQPDGVSVKHNFKFGGLLYSMVRSELAELSPQLSTQLLYCAMRGRSLPQAALAVALHRQRIEPASEEAMRRAIIVARIALIKACLRRSQTPLSPDTPNPSHAMSESLNPESQDAAYLCGRLFAVFDRLQYLALGGVNAGVVERYYAGASVTPALVMARLFRNAQFHLAKAEGGIAENVRKDFESICSALGDHFPPTLGLEAQGRFALGYYHQKADYRRRTAERKTRSEQAETAAPSTIDA